MPRTGDRSTSAGSGQVADGAFRGKSGGETVVLIGKSHSWHHAEQRDSVEASPVNSLFELGSVVLAADMRVYLSEQSTPGGPKGRHRGEAENARKNRKPIRPTGYHLRGSACLLARV